MISPKCKTIARNNESKLCFRGKGQTAVYMRESKRKKAVTLDRTQWAQLRPVGRKLKQQFT